MIQLSHHLYMLWNPCPPRNRQNTLAIVCTFLERSDDFGGQNHNGEVGLYMSHPWEGGIGIIKLIPYDGSVVLAYADVLRQTADDRGIAQEADLLPDYLHGCQK